MLPYRLTGFDVLVDSDFSYNQAQDLSFVDCLEQSNTTWVVQGLHVYGVVYLICRVLDHVSSPDTDSHTYVE